MTIKERLEQNNDEIAVCIELAKQFSSAGVATGLSVGASETATKNEEAINGNVHLNLTGKNGVMDSHKIVGTNGASVTSDEDGTITISSVVGNGLTLNGAALNVGAGTGILVDADAVSIAAAGTSLGGVKSGGDVTINDGEITVNQATKAATCDLSTITTTLGNLHSRFIRTTTDVNFTNSGSTTAAHTIPAWSIGFYGCNNGADGAILTIDPTGHIKTAYRNSGVWGNSRTILDNSNYNSYAPKLDGTGATGIWGINISGNAATATKATKDSDGNTITSTYLAKSGGTMTGNITFTDAAGTGIITDIPSTITGGWSRGWYWKTTNGTTGIGCLGSAANFTYMYVGGDWQNPWMKVQPNGNVTATKFVGALEGTANFSKKINECQTNTINSTTNDTVANWGKQNTSIHFYSTSGLLNN